LCENLGSQKAAVKAAEVFLEAFVKSMPTGKQNSFANRTLPSVVIIQIRDTQPVSLVGAFEKPVYASGNESVTEVACKRLVAHENAIDAAFGVAPQQTYITCGAPLVKEALEGMEGIYAQLDEAIAGASEQIAAYLALAGCGLSTGD
jgi:CRISPR system Cascade subunit CasC